VLEAARADDHASPGAQETGGAASGDDGSGDRSGLQVEVGERGVVAALAGVSGTPAARSTGLFGIQIPAPERAADPPKVAAFSTTTQVRPCSRALRA